MSRGIQRVAGIIALATLGACVDSSSISIEDEREMGSAVAAQASREMPLLDDEPVVRFVRELGGHIVDRADTTGRDYEFRVVDSEVPNAFAIPGGFIFVNRGILERAETASELAGVLAHEIGHVVERHGLEQMAKAQNTNAAVSLVYVLLGRAPGAAEQVALQVAGSAWMAKHSREAEMEADRVAVRYLTLAGLDPRGMPRFFERLLEEERGSPNELLAWFSTHPLTEDRIADAEAMIEQLPPDAVERGARDLPQFAQVRRRLDALPPSPPEPTALP
ncbi:MAG TPA: M48 family metallopeptidase [Gemmatimonadaceae bacterium]|nr:M48 family metallopeptidase [Gemmatimonadaceae bacterium]